MQHLTVCCPSLAPCLPVYLMHQWPTIQAIPSCLALLVPPPAPIKLPHPGPWISAISVAALCWDPTDLVPWDSELWLITAKLKDALKGPLTQCPKTEVTIFPSHTPQRKGVVCSFKYGGLGIKSTGWIPHLYLGHRWGGDNSNLSSSGLVTFLHSLILSYLTMDPPLPTALAFIQAPLPHIDAAPAFQLPVWPARLACLQLQPEWFPPKQTSKSFPLCLGPLHWLATILRSWRTEFLCAGPASFSGSASPDPDSRQVLRTYSIQNAVGSS